MKKIKRALVWILKSLRIYGIFILLITFFRLEYYYWSQKNKKGIPVVIVDHNFIQDIEALRRQSEKCGINLIRIPYEPIRKMAAVYFSEDIRDGSYESPQMYEPRSLYRNAVRRLFILWRPKSKFEAFLSPSDSFFWIREVIVQLKNLGVPCVVIDKEGTISPHSMEKHSKRISEYYPFISDFIIVWSDRQKKFWMRTGVKEEKILVEGQPRSDFFLNKDMWKLREQVVGGFSKVVLFFTFALDAYSPKPNVPLWNTFRRDLHEAIVKLAEGHSDVLFVVKTHPQQKDAQEVERYFKYTQLKNVLIAHGPESSRHLTVHADLVVGFQTTALIEAMLAGKKVVYAQWGDEVCESLPDLIPFHQASGIEIVKSKSSFIQLIDSVLTHNAFEVSADERELRKSFLDTYLPNADGRVAQRVMRDVCQIAGIQ